jgi:hypothetical protein
MHPFKKLCKHAQFQIDMKGHYTQQEYDACEGKCWQCDGPLELDTMKLPPHTDLSRVGMSKKDREELEADPVKMQKLLDSLNKPRTSYWCKPCFMARLEESKKGPFTAAKDILADLKDPDGKWYHKKLELIKEVEECGPECPYWDRLDTYRQNIADRHKKIEEDD